MKKATRFLALFHIVTAAEIIAFWVFFYSGVLFPEEVLAPRIAQFEGYYAWETAFTIPDSLMALAMVIGGVRLYRDDADSLGRTLLLAASGGCIFLGVLDANYGLANGMYALGHLYSWVLASIGVYMPIFGLVSIYLLHTSTPAGLSSKTGDNARA